MFDKYEAFEHRQYEDGTISSFKVDLDTWKLVDSLDDEADKIKEKEIFKFRSLRYVMPDKSVVHITLYKIYLTDDIINFVEAEKEYDRLNKPIQSCICSEELDILCYSTYTDSE